MNDMAEYLLFGTLDTLAAVLCAPTHPPSRVPAGVPPDTTDVPPGTFWEIAQRYRPGTPWGTPQGSPGGHPSDLPGDPPGGSGGAVQRVCFGDTLRVHIDDLGERPPPVPPNHGWGGAFGPPPMISVPHIISM